MRQTDLFENFKELLYWSYWWWLYSSSKLSPVELRLILNNATIADVNTIALTQCVIDPAVFLLLDCLLKANHDYFRFRFAIYRCVGVFQEKHKYSLRGKWRETKRVSEPQKSSFLAAPWILQSINWGLLIATSMLPLTADCKSGSLRISLSTLNCIPVLIEVFREQSTTKQTRGSGGKERKKMQR